LPTTPTIVAVWPAVASIPLRKKNGESEETPLVWRRDVGHDEARFRVTSDRNESRHRHIGCGRDRCGIAEVHTASAMSSTVDGRPIGDRLSITS
jgi:hypothetical protein